MISPWAKNQLSPSWTIGMTRDNGAIMDLTGVTPDQLSLVVYDATFTQTGTGNGSFTILNARPGVVRYTPAAPDASSVGTFYVRVKISFGGIAPDMSDYILWQVFP